MPTNALIYLIAGAIPAFFIAHLIASTAALHVAYTGDKSKPDDHKLHRGNVPRVGGIAILFGTICTAIACGALGFNGSRDYLLLIVSVSPLFAAGLLEDLTKKVPGYARYLAAALSAGIFILLFQTPISAIDIPGFDGLLSISVISVLFTLFAIAGLAHSLNLIDGQNGLCAGTTILVALSIAFVAGREDQWGLALVSLSFAGANLGFIALNYPSGKIFLGDCGAYMNGAILGMLAILIVERSAGSISPWFAILVLIYPIAETLFSMRRRWKVGASMTQPDTAHLHSLWHKIDRDRKGFLQRSSAPRFWAGFLPFVGLASIAYQSTAIMICASFVFACVYRHQYLIATRIQP